MKKKYHQKEIVQKIIKAKQIASDNGIKITNHNINNILNLPKNTITRLLLKFNISLKDPYSKKEVSYKIESNRNIWRKEINIAIKKLLSNNTKPTLDNIAIQLDVSRETLKERIIILKTSFINGFYKITKEEKQKKITKEEKQKERIERAIAQTDGKISYQKIASILGCSRQNVNKIMKKYNININ
ncbi:MAG: hypothetical protein ACRC0A_07780 [Chitinophagaceae bacterium]